jgi:hypothetical protein
MLAVSLATISPSMMADLVGSSPSTLTNRGKRRLNRLPLRLYSWAVLSRERFTQRNSNWLHGWRAGVEHAVWGGWMAKLDGGWAR